MKIPAHGLSKDDVYEKLDAAKKADLAWRGGKAFAYVYDGGSEIEEVAKRAFTSFLTENALDPTSFPSLLRFENDLVAMARNHLSGDESVRGSFTSGGTESIILALKAARDLAKAERGITQPQVIVPVTAHAAFHKAGHYLGIEIITTGVDGASFRADVEAMANAITPNTIMLVGSASGYAHGVVDPIEEIAALSAKHGLLCHVDGCIGGFLLPYFARHGAKVPLFDFRVPGVTSMSMDFHKYALTPKGASVVLYRSDDLRRPQFYACASWAGYTMINPTIQSSKSGGPLAAAWAVLNFVGDDGYMKIARGLLDAKNALVEGINAIPGLRVMGCPEMSLIGFTSDSIPVFPIADAIKKRGFYIQPQLAYGPSQENLHLSVQPSNLPWIKEFLAALADSAEEAKAGAAAYADAKASGAMFAEQLSVPGAEAMLPGLVAAMGVGAGGAMPSTMSEINALLNALPRPIQEKLLVFFAGMLFTPTNES